MTSKKSRRAFLADSAAGVGSVWLAANWPAILEAEAYAQRAATADQPVPFAFFTDAQAADIDAMASQILPTTDTPGAHEAHIVNFIDRGLVTFARERQARLHSRAQGSSGARRKRCFRARPSSRP